MNAMRWTVWSCSRLIVPSRARRRHSTIGARRQSATANDRTLAPWEANVRGRIGVNEDRGTRRCRTAEPRRWHTTIMQSALYVALTGMHAVQLQAQSRVISRFDACNRGDAGDALPNWKEDSQHPRNFVEVLELSARGDPRVVLGSYWTKDAPRRR